MIDKKDLVAIGKIVAPQGNKGEVRLNALTDFLERFKDLDRVILKDKNLGFINYKVTGVRFRRNQVVLKFQGCNTRSEAFKLVGSLVWIPKEERVKLPPDHYYIDEIMDLDVFTTEDKFLGKVTNIYKTGANDVYEIDKRILIPATKEVVKKVDLEQGMLVIHLMEGLIDGH